MSTLENPPPPTQVANIYHAYYKFSMYPVAVVGFQEAELEVS